MPEISRFFRLCHFNSMFYSEHNPPHFHARYGKDKAAIEVNSLRVLEGWIPPKAIGLVMVWAAEHREELMQCWDAARSGTMPQRIEPL